jgi:hypothetical protein
MASVTFAGTTIWADTGTGLGDVEPAFGGQHANWAIETIPGGTGLIVKDLGTLPEIIMLSLNYHLSNSAAASLRTSLQGLATSAGALVANGVTYSNCVLMGHTWQIGRWQLRDGSGGRAVQITFQFQQYRI